MDIIQALLGVSLLMFGRRIFWLCIGIIGFILGLEIATRFIGGLPQWALISIALLSGVAGALLAMVLQHVVVGVAGFLVGGFLVTACLDILMVDTGGYSVLIFVVSGIIGAIVIICLFGWALIILSSLTGAALLSQAIDAGMQIKVSLFVISVIAGLVMQTSLLKKKG